MDFLELRLTCRLTRTKAASLFDRSEQTIKIWDKGKAPSFAVTFLKYLSHDLSYYNKAWRGFYFDGDVIITPSKTTISPGDILSIPYLVQTINITGIAANDDIY